MEVCCDQVWQQYESVSCGSVYCDQVWQRCDAPYSLTVAVWLLSGLWCGQNNEDVMCVCTGDCYETFLCSSEDGVFLR